MWPHSEWFVHPLLMLPKVTWVRTQLTRPSTSVWYYPSVPGGSETQHHCVTLSWIDISLMQIVCGHCCYIHPLNAAWFLFHYPNQYLSRKATTAVPIHCGDVSSDTFFPWFPNWGPLARDKGYGSFPDGTPKALIFVSVTLWLGIKNKKIKFKHKNCLKAYCTQDLY